MGDLIGERQAGSFDLRLARLPDDADLLGQAKDLAREIVDADPMLTQRRHALLKERALGRYPRAVELFRTG